MEKAPELLAQPPVIETVDIVEASLTLFSSGLKM
jgi:hypothetical protein